MQELPAFRFALSEVAHTAYLRNKMEILLLYGQTGEGKSSYALQVMKDVNHERLLDRSKRYLVWRPEHFTGLTWQLAKDHERAEVITWDDAGVWMFALEWNDPRIKEAMKVMQLARTVTSCIVMTTPSLGMVLKKLQGMEGMLMGKVVERGNDPMDRLAQAWRNNIAPWGKRYVHHVLDDPFNVMMPDEDWAWYQPRRDRYFLEAIEAMADKFGVTPEAAYALFQSYLAGK